MVRKIDDDLVDARGREQPELPLDEAFTTDVEQGFRLRLRQRTHALAASGGK
jgi:hypothetical protein